MNSKSSALFNWNQISPVNFSFKQFSSLIIVQNLAYLVTTVIGAVLIITLKDNQLVLDAWPSLEFIIPFIDFETKEYILFLIGPFMNLVLLLYPISIFTNSLIYLSSLVKIKCVKFNWNSLQTLYYCITFPSIILLLLFGYGKYNMILSDPYTYRNSLTTSIPANYFFTVFQPFQVLYIFIPWISTSLIIKNVDVDLQKGKRMAYFSNQNFFLFSSTLFTLLMIAQKAQALLYILALVISFIILTVFKTGILITIYNIFNPLKSILNVIRNFKFVLFTFLGLFVYFGLSYAYYGEAYEGILFHILHPFLRMSNSLFVYFPIPPDISMPYRGGLGLLGFGGQPIDDIISVGRIIYGSEDGYVTAASNIRAYALGGWHGYWLSIIITNIFLLMISSLSNTKNGTCYYLLPLGIYFAYYATQIAIHELLFGSYGFLFPFFIAILFFPNKKPLSPIN